MLIAVSRLSVMVEVLVGVAHAVPGTGLAPAFAEVLQNGECLLAVGEPLLILAELDVVRSDHVERVGLSGTVARRSEQFQGRTIVGECVAVAALSFQEPAEVEVMRPWPAASSSSRKSIQRPQQVIAGVVMVVQPDMGAAEAVVSAGKALPVGPALRGTQCGAMDGEAGPANAPAGPGRSSGSTPVARCGEKPASIAVSTALSSAGCSVVSQVLAPS